MRTLLTNGNVVTLDPAMPRAGRLLIEDGRIAALEVDLEPSPDVEVVDLGGRTVLPAFVDCHTHFAFTGCQVVDLSLAGCTSTIELQERLRDRVAGENNEVVRGWQLDDSQFTDRRPTLDDLDAISSERPIVLSRIGNGAALLNSAAMETIGFGDGVATVEQGDGGPTGWVWGEANYRVLEFALSSLTDDEIRAVVAATASLALRQGTTVLHAIEGSFVGQARGDRGRENAWLQRLTPSLSSQPVEIVVLDTQLDSPADLKRIARNGHRVAGGDFFLDGVLGAAYVPGMARAALDEPYLDGDLSSGHLALDDKTAAAFFRAAAMEGISLGAHSVGERATAQFLDAWEAALRDIPEARSLRPRVDHGILVRPHDIDRAAELGVVFSMQPVFETRSGGPQGSYAKRIGAARAQKTNQFRSLLAAGIVLVGGSDSPLNAIAPLEGIRAAVNHSVEDERLTPIEAIELFTKGAAYAAFLEEDHGQLKPGFVADLVVLDSDPTDVQSLPESQVLATWHRGVPVYEDSAPHNRMLVREA